MSQTSLRLRMFAGPNGSGKSTLKSVISENLLGIYINPDEIEKQLVHDGFLDFSQFELQVSQAELQHFFRSSTLLKQAGLLKQIDLMHFNDNQLWLDPTLVNSYHASVVADFMRQKLLQAGKSLTLETVMSSPDKVDLLRRAQAKGFRTYLYYVATEEPEINIFRVRHRVKAGGHDVPEDKIRGRYTRSLALLALAIRHTNRAYIC